MPACSVLFRHHLPLFVAFKSYLAFKVRILTARFSTRGSSSGGLSNWRFFSLGGSKRCAHSQHLSSERSHGEPVGMRKLPEVSKGIHKMWTARSFILGSRKDMAMDDAEDGITADNN